MAHASACCHGAVPWWSAPRKVQQHVISCDLQMLCKTPSPSSGARWPQVGHKGMLYMQLHAEAVLDLVERAPREVQFRAVSGDFQVLQGKFIVSQPSEVRPCGCHEDSRKQNVTWYGLSMVCSVHECSDCSVHECMRWYGLSQAHQRSISHVHSW